jgi:chromosome segregation protein
MTKVLKIVMHGFKSFAKRTEILFDDKFNCVLGPNGSGKSNLLDAICFVLGKSSAKGLRAEKSSNLVYNGGKKNQPAKEGRVSIYFDNSKKTFPTDENIVKLTRIVKADGSSKYLINDKTRTRQQIIDLMAIAKINPDGYNIVLQGDIMKFIEMSPNEKRKVIEEISGISIYEEKKDKALKELLKVEEKLGEAQIILKERKSYLEDLKGERDQALKYKELNDKIKYNKAAYLKIQLDKKLAKKEELQKSRKKYQDLFDSLQNKVRDNKKKIEDMKKEVVAISREVEQKGEKDQVSLQKEVEDIRVSIASDKTKIESMQEEIERIKKRKESLGEDMKETEQKIKELNDKLNTLEERKKRREKEKGEFENKIQVFKKKHKLDSDTDEIDKKIEEIDKQTEKKQIEIQKLREHQQEMVREQDKIEYHISSIDEQVKKVEEVQKEHKKEIDALQEKRKKFKIATLELNKALDRSSTLAAEIGNSEDKVHAYREQLSKLTVRNAQIKENIQGNIAIQKILELKKTEKGIFGTVADLGKVSSKYSLALEVAAGPRIRGIVVEDDKVAATCINYLKKNRLGVATFLPLNKIKPIEQDQNVSKYSNVQGCHGEATKLVSYDSRFKKIFSYVFGNTIIIDDINVSRRIGVGNVRMATISGDLVETSGSMQGGFRERDRKGGGFQEKELTDDIEKIERNIAEIENALSAYMKERKENEDTIVRLREEKATLEGEIIKTEKSLHLKSDDLDASVIQKKNLTEDKKIIEKNIRENTVNISKINKEMALLKIERQKHKDKVAQLRNPRLLAELQTFDEKRRELTEEIIRLDSEITGLKTQNKDIFKRDKESSEKIIKDIEKEEKQFTDIVKKLQDKIKKDAETLKDKEKNLEKFYKQFKELFKKRSTIEDDIRNIEIENAQTEEKSRGEERKSNTVQLQEAQINAELSVIEEDYKEYKDIKIDTKKSEEQLRKEIKDFENMRENIGSVNLRALDIYENVEKEYNSLLEKNEKLVQEKMDVLSLMEEIEGKKKELFMKTFNVVNEHFMLIFSRISAKGEAYLELENKEIPFDGGMVVRVKLSGTKFMDLRSLSGGEKSLTALAFIFAIQEYEPATFYVLDEVDAALDKRNSEKLADLIRIYSEKAQYIIISHHDGVISGATSLFGISMDQETGMSKVVSLKV